MPQKAKYEDLREACIQEAIAIIETSGLENLSLREVSRRLGVSHQAPYKHFPSRDHILAEIVSRTFEAFAHYLDEHQRTGDEPHTRLSAMGEAYLRYAAEHPLQYRLMFGTALPDVNDHPDMMKNAQQAFNLLRKCVAALPTSKEPEMEALFIWSTLHGIASILQTRIMDVLELPEDALEKAKAHMMMRLELALGQ